MAVPLAGAYNGAVSVDAPAPESADAKDLFLQPPLPGTPPPLEMFTLREAPNESLFCAQGLTQADFGNVFSREILPLDILIYRIPPDLLQAALWEPLTKEGENAVREKKGGIIVRAEAEWTLLWRSDRAEGGRLLRDGVEAPAELLQGYVLRTTGEGLAALVRAWDGRGRFEWVALQGLSREAPGDVLDAVHADLAQLKVSIPEEVFLFASEETGARAVFTRGEHLHRAIGALLRGYVGRFSRTRPGGLSRPVSEQVAGLSDGRGLSSSPERDIIDKGRTIEVTARLGGTPWSVSPRAARGPRGGPEKVLLYYDRTSGLWAVAG